MRHKKKPDGLQRNAASIDGFVTDGRRLGVPSSRSYQPSRGDQTPSLDSLSRRPDGFHAMRQSPGGLGGTAAEVAEQDALLDEPIVLDDIGDEKRKDRIHGKVRRARWRKAFKRTALVMLVLILATAGFIGYKFYSTQKQ